MEVLDTDIVLGMYATQTWIDNRKGYGDGKFQFYMIIKSIPLIFFIFGNISDLLQSLPLGECFIFRLAPDPKRFAYKVKASHPVSFDCCHLHLEATG